MLEAGRQPLLLLALPRRLPRRQRERAALRHLRVNLHAGQRWFHRETMAALLDGLEALGADAKAWRRAAAASDCDLDALLALL